MEFISCTIRPILVSCFFYSIFFPQNYLLDKTFSSLVWNLETFSEICIYVYIEIYVYYTAFFVSHRKGIFADFFHLKLTTVELDKKERFHSAIS